MGFGSKKSDPPPAPRSTPDADTYAPPAETDPVNTQLNISPESRPLLSDQPKPKSTPLLG